MSRIKALINLIIYFIFSFFASGVILIILQNQNPSSSTNDLIKEISSNLDYLAIINGIILVIILIINFNYLKEKISDSFKNIGETISYALKGYVIVMGINVILSIIVVSVSIDRTTSGNQQIIDSMLNNTSVFNSILVVGILGPILEELIFRMSVLGLLIKDKVTKSWLPYLLAALLFTFIHDITVFTAFSPASFITFLSYFLPALGLVFVYRYSKHNIVSVIILHMVYNTIPIILGG